jgi:hypothetical protein
MKICCGLAEPWLRAEEQAICIDFLKSPVTFQMIERGMCPPSSGNPGIRSKPPNKRFATARESRTASAEALLPYRGKASRKATTASRKLAIGPAMATRNSTPGRCMCSSMEAIPPKMNAEDRER